MAANTKKTANGNNGSKKISKRPITLTEEQTMDATKNIVYRDRALYLFAEGWEPVDFEEEPVPVECD